MKCQYSYFHKILITCLQYCLPFLEKKKLTLTKPKNGNPPPYRILPFPLQESLSTDRRYGCTTICPPWRQIHPRPRRRGEPHLLGSWSPVGEVNLWQARPCRARKSECLGARRFAAAAPAAHRRVKLPNHQQIHRRHHLSIVPAPPLWPLGVMVLPSSRRHHRCGRRWWGWRTVTVHLDHQSRPDHRSHQSRLLFE